MSTTGLAGASARPARGRRVLWALLIWTIVPAVLLVPLAFEVNIGSPLFAKSRFLTAYWWLICGGMLLVSHLVASIHAIGNADFRWVGRAVFVVALWFFPGIGALVYYVVALFARRRYGLLSRSMPPDWSRG